MKDFHFRERSNRRDLLLSLERAVRIPASITAWSGMGFLFFYFATNLPLSLLIISHLWKLMDKTSEDF